MIIKFNSIRLSNFMSFDDVTIKLNNTGYTLVSGKNESVDDSAGSNGSGKSSIWEGIVWALTGETIRGNKNVVNMFGSDGALVVLDFDVDSHNFTIQRTKDHSKLKSSLIIFYDGKDISGKGIRDSEFILKQHLPDLTSSLLSSVIILGQGLPQRFSNNTPSGRKQVLEELSKSDFMIEDLKQRISKRKNFLTSELDNTQKSIVSITTKKGIFEKQLTEVKESLEELNLSNSSELQEQLKEVENKCLELNSELVELQDQVTTNRSKVDSFKDEFYEKQSECNSKVNEITSKYSAKSTELSISIAKIETDLSSNKNELHRLKNITDVCPTCGQKLQGVEKPDTKPVEDEIIRLEDSLQKVKEEQAELKKQESVELKENDAIYVDVLTSIQKKKEEVVKQVEQDEKQSRLLGREIESLNKKQIELEHKLNTLALDRKVLEDKMSSITAELERLASELLYYNNEEEDTKNRLVIVNKMETVVKRDFRGCLLKGVIEFIDTRAKFYSSVVFGNELLEFKQEGNNISISFDGKEYESLSGGEQKKLDIIIQLAIRDMLCKLMNFSSNILVCDEIFDALDLIGCQKIIDLVSSHLEDVSSVFIVTHRDNLCIPCDNEITVIKDMNKISHVIQKA